MTVDTDFSAELLRVLRTATASADLGYANPPQPLTGGFWAELFAFSLAGPPQGAGSPQVGSPQDWPRELVVRLMPDPALARKETIIQAAVAAAGYPTPVVRASGGPDSGLGRAFMVMDRAPGAHLLSGLSGAGAITSAMRALGQIPRLLAVAMANLHEQDPRLVRDRLGCDVPVTVSGLLALLHAAASEYRRPDLTAAARWLADHPPPPAPEVICHGDLHPFNVLVDGASFTVLDWSAALLAPRAYDVAFTSLLLAEPPLTVPRAMRPAVRGLGAWLASRFAVRYQRAAGARIDPRELRWHQGVACLRTLTEVAGWTQDQLAGARAGHPWLRSGPAFAARLTALTGSDVRAR